MTESYETLEEGNDMKRTMTYRDCTLELGGRTLIMGILNVTPDSFSDGGLYQDLDAAVSHAREMVEQGADIIDIGGESTRPGHEPVSLEEELKRVIPVVRAIRAAGIRVPLSVDTYKAEVARQALEAGAHIINDIWGLKADPAMAGVVAEYGCPVILMHNRQEPARYRNFMADVLADLMESVNLARQAGVEEEKIILDPGVGFAKTHEENLLVMSRLQDIVRLGYPVLLGASRKRVIRHTLGLGLEQIREAKEGTVATTVWGIAQGCAIVRVHDVRENKHAALMADAIKQAGAFPPSAHGNQGGDSA